MCDILPNDMYMEIFSHLDLVDFKHVKLVSKKFYTLYQLYKPKIFKRKIDKIIIDKGIRRALQWASYQNNRYMIDHIAKYYPYDINDIFDGFSKQKICDFRKLIEVYKKYIDYSTKSLTIENTIILKIATLKVRNSTNRIQHLL